mmetsp:Transcript_37940/g.76675  ORF Transcript_37940/g.76675 Transcript_37940/m.76675 type:complete len:1384 (-) Transcript_37940:372-4523(-)
MHSSPLSYAHSEVNMGYDFSDFHFKDLLESESLWSPTPNARNHIVGLASNALDDVHVQHPSLTRASPSMVQAMDAQWSKISAAPFCSVCTAPPKASKAYLDSGSEVNLFAYDDAMSLFRSLGISSLKVVGVSGLPNAADVEGRLIITLKGPSGKLYRLDLGTAHGMKGCPMNLLSLSLMIDKGSVIHFESGNCYIVPAGAKERIPLTREGGLFSVPLSPDLYGDHKYAQLVGAGGEFEDDRLHYSFAVGGYSFLSGDLNLWHKRLAHLSKEKLMRIHGHNLVDGFHLVGNKNTHCGCDSCTQARIKRAASKHSAPYNSNAPTRIGERVSTDVKSINFPSFDGYKYVVVFVDWYSGLGMPYFMRSKTEVVAKFKQFVDEMAFYGIQIGTLSSDRGSEYFSQEGHLIPGRDRSLSELDAFCASQTPKIKHIVTPVECKEKIAETWFRDHFYNARTPNEKSGISTPWTMLTGQRTRWDKLRVFGADAYLHRPNNSLAKVPGIVRGQKLIFVGFSPNANGYRLFDPENRRYLTHSDCVFYESFRHRVDALRHHDQRRALLKNGEAQPLVIDDFDDENAEGVRNLFLHPDAPKPRQENDDNIVPAPAAGEQQAAAEEQPTTTTTPEVSTPTAEHGEARARARARNSLQSASILRPLRLLPVGTKVPFSVEDQKFINHIMDIEAPISFIANPKRRGTLSHLRYRRYMMTTNIREATELGATRDDLRWDHQHGFIRYPKHESLLPGHVFCAVEEAEKHGLTHVIDDVGLYATQVDHTDYLLSRAFASKTLERAKYLFNEVLATAYDPDLLEGVLRTKRSADKFAETQFQKVLTSSTVNIDFSLSPEPVRYDDAIDSDEGLEWQKAMDDEMESMAQFGVFSKVPKSAARGRQILGCKWVYKRKVNKHGEVYRYKGRLVAQGFAQRAYDSYNPDECSSPVVHKDSLRLFLSVCAAQNLSVYQADVKSAFLQAPLSERIYMRAPPGYSSTTAEGEEEIIELRQAVYGLKQSSAAFWTAINAHLTSLGFTSLVGDPCVFRLVLPNGKIILACTYVDDVTFGVPDVEARDEFMKMLRARFVIDEGEGAPVEWLLGMAIHQDLAAGTIFMNMEMAITKLAHGILTPEEIAKSTSVRTPMLVTPLSKLKERETPKETFDYLSVVGSLIHIANCVRCDISLAVGVLARHSLTVGPAHIKAAKRVVQYLYNTRYLGITYRRPPPNAPANIPLMYEAAKHPLDNGLNRLQTFADSDYAGDESKRSTMGNLVMLNGGPIAWSSVLGKTVATSTCEAEINAAVVAVKDALHFSRLLEDLSGTVAVPLQIAEDNSACIAQASAGIRHVRNAKHYEVKLRFLQQLVVDRKVQFVYCPTDHQLADFFTKPLDEDKFTYLRNQLLT